MLSFPVRGILYRCFITPTKNSISETCPRPLYGESCVINDGGLPSKVRTLAVSMCCSVVSYLKHSRVSHIRSTTGPPQGLRPPALGVPGSAAYRSYTLSVRAPGSLYKTYRYPLHLSPFSLFASSTVANLPLSLVSFSTISGSPTSKEEISRWRGDQV